MGNNFTVEDGIEIQDRQLKEWKSVLKPKVYKVVHSLVKEKNVDLLDGFSVCRGIEIDTIVNNQMIRNNDTRRESKETTGTSIPTQG